MTKTVQFLLFCLCLSITCYGRDYDYKWDEYKIKPQQIPQISTIAKALPIKVSVGPSSGERKVWVKWGMYKYNGSDLSLAEAIVAQFEKEIGKVGVITDPQSPASLEIAVSTSSIEEGSYMRAVTITFCVKCGDGKIYDYSVKNSAPGVPYRAYNGAVSLAVVKILNSPEILTYINRTSSAH